MASKIKDWIHNGFMKIENFFFDRPLFKFFLLFGALIAITILNTFFPNTFIKIPPYFMLFFVILLFVYLVMLVIRLVRRSLKKLLTARTIWGLISSYVLFVIGVLLLISFCFSTIEHLGLGYLKYGQCSDKFDIKQITEDPNISRDYIYFSAVTYFTVGYGDICPMGFERTMAIFTMFIGNMINVIVMVIVINNYISRKN